MSFSFKYIFSREQALLLAFHMFLAFMFSFIARSYVAVVEANLVILIFVLKTNETRKMSG